MNKMDEKMVLQEVFDKILQKNSWREILTTIFETNIQQDKPNMISDVVLALGYAFNINGMVIINTLVSEEINLNSMDLEDKFKEIKEVLELLSAKYKVQLVLGIEKNKNPFGMNGIGFNLEPGMSNTILNFSRKDGKIFSTSYLLFLVMNMK